MKQNAETASTSSGDSLSAARYISSRQLQKSALRSSTGRHWVRPRIRRWNACECALTNPGMSARRGSRCASGPACAAGTIAWMRSPLITSARSGTKRPFSQSRSGTRVVDIGREREGATLRLARSVAGLLLQLGAAADDRADQAVVDRGVRREPEVAPRVVHDLLERLARLLCEHAVQALTHLHDLARLDLDVRCAAACTAPRLVQQVACVRQRVALLLRHGDVDQRARTRD